MKLLPSTFNAGSEHTQDIATALLSSLPDRPSSPHPVFEVRTLKPAAEKKGEEKDEGAVSVDAVASGDSGLAGTSSPSK